MEPHPLLFQFGPNPRQVKLADGESEFTDGHLPFPDRHLTVGKCNGLVADDLVAVAEGVRSMLAGGSRCFQRFQSIRNDLASGRIDQSNRLADGSKVEAEDFADHLPVLDRDWMVVLSDQAKASKARSEVFAEGIEEEVFADFQLIAVECQLGSEVFAAGGLGGDLDDQVRSLAAFFPGLVGRTIPVLLDAANHHDAGRDVASGIPFDEVKEHIARDINLGIIGELVAEAMDQLDHGILVDRCFGHRLAVAFGIKYDGVGGYCQAGGGLGGHWRLLSGRSGKPVGWIDDTISPRALWRKIEDLGRALALDTSAFDFDLPPDLIAQEACEPRDTSRLLVIRRDLGTWEHRTFAELPELLKSGDVLVRNNSRVVPARLIGKRLATGGRWEGLYLRTMSDGRWEILAKTRGRPELGEAVIVGQGLRLILIERLGDGRWVVRPEGEGDGAVDLLDRHGSVPIPPYIRKGVESSEDRSRYQTVYAQVPGSVAAPTAGLHFTSEVFQRLDERGVTRVDLTLHVGIGTFRPIEVDRIEDHTLHAESAELSAEAASTLNATRQAGGRIIAVGTTSARVLETCAAATGRFEPFAAETAFYLRPGHEFRGVDALLTNFHLPRSSLLVLVAALAGVDLIRAAYAEAVRERYRFYSYGDAMLIL